MAAPSKVLAVTVTTVLLLLAGCSKTADDGAARTNDTSTPDETASEDEQPDTTERPPGELDWTACGGLDCATLEVPLDYDEPDGETVEIEIARNPARDEEDRIGVVLVNPGGPGASGVEYVQSGALDNLTERFDVIGWDPRAVGDSTALECASDTGAEQAAEDLRTLDPEPDDDAEQQALDDAGEELADRCGELDRAYLENLDSEVTARDIEEIRRALGEEQISFVGYSYGTLLGQEYARLHPDRVRAMVLDGVVDPSKSLTDFLEEQAVGLDGVLAEVGDQYDRLLAQLEQEPVKTRRGDDVGPAELAIAAFSSSYTAGGMTTLARAMSDAERGNGDDLARLAASYTASGDYTAYVATLCADSDHPEGGDEWKAFADRLREVAPRLGAAVANEVLPCAFWAVPPTREPSPVRPEGLAPVLVVGTTGDVATPYEDAVRVAENLPGAVLLTYEGEGHTATASTCVDRAVETYLVELELPESGTVCTS